MKNEQEPEHLSCEWHAREASRLGNVCDEACSICGEEAEDSWRRKAETFRDRAAKLRMLGEVLRLLDCEGPAEDQIEEIRWALRKNARIQGKAL